MNSNSLIVELQGITKFYPSTTLVTEELRSIDLQIKTGEYCAIVGASGSGRSTLGNIIGCLERPSAGKYYFKGIAVDRFDDRQLEFLRNHQIGFVFKQFDLLPDKNALENVMLSIRFAGIPNLKHFNQAAIALKKVGLESYLYKYPNRLSQEQKQKVEIARSIVNQPILLIVYEPSAIFGFPASKEIMAIFTALNRSGITIIIVTDNYKIARSCQRIIHIKNGRVNYNAIRY